MFCSEIVPVALPPLTSGTKRTDLGASAAPTTSLPYRSDSARRFSAIRSDSPRLQYVPREAVAAPGSACNRLPRSIMYG